MIIHENLRQIDIKLTIEKIEKQFIFQDFDYITIIKLRFYIVQKLVRKKIKNIFTILLINKPGKVVHRDTLLLYEHAG